MSYCPSIALQKHTIANTIKPWSSVLYYKSPPSTSTEILSKNVNIMKTILKTPKKT